MVHYFDVISCGIKQMHAQFSLLFGLHNAMVFLSNRRACLQAKQNRKAYSLADDNYCIKENY